MRLKSKLSKWVQRGLITDAQQDDILSFERGRMARHFAMGMQLCGGFAILLGIALVVAANWHELGRYAKLIAHLVLNAGLSFWLFKTGYNQAKPVLQELLCLALFGLNLTFIGLIGQVFQLDGKITEALVVWMIISAPMMMVYARAGFAAWLWTIALYVTAFMAFDHYSQGLDEYGRFMLGYFLALFLPIALYADHCVTATRVFRPAFAGAFRKTSLLVLVVLASVSSLIFYSDAFDEVLDEAGSAVLHYGFMLIITALSLAYVVFIKRYFAKVYDTGYDGGLLLLSAVFMALPWLMGVESSVMAALHFMLFWILIGVLAQRHAAEGLVTLAIALVTIRLYIIFLELFGDALMDTGLGLIIAGAVMIAFVKLGQNFRKCLIAEPRQGGAS